MAEKQATKKQSRKVGKNAARCAAYRTKQRCEFNKARRLKHYVRKHPQDLVAVAAIERLKKVLYTSQLKELKL